MELVADCARCAGLCCVALPFQVSREFPENKPAGAPCRNLLADHRCGIHDRLRTDGWLGCTTFDCAGAGQATLQHFGGTSWRQEPGIAEDQFTMFELLRPLHEMAFHLQGLLDLPDLGSSESLSLNDLRERIEHRASCRIIELRELGVGDLQAEASELFRTASRNLRGRDHRPRVVPGADLRAADLDAADLRGALLLAVDLRGARLRRTDLLGADLRDVRLDGADLSEALFLTQAQLNAGNGDAATGIPPRLRRPSHWR